VSKGTNRPKRKLKICGVDLLNLEASGEDAARTRFGSFGRLVGNYATSLRRIVLRQQELATPPTLSVWTPDSCMSHWPTLQSRRWMCSISVTVGSRCIPTVRQSPSRIPLSSVISFVIKSFVSLQVRTARLYIFARWGLMRVELRRVMF